MATFDVNWSGTLVAAAAAVVGVVLCPIGTSYAPATAANLAIAGRISGVAITPASSQTPQFTIQYSGEVANSITGLGAGVAAAVGINPSTGAMQRLVGTYPASTYVVGDCDAAGNVTLCPVSRVNPALPNVTWANDLAGSTNVAQNVSAIGSAGGVTFNLPIGNSGGSTTTVNLNVIVGLTTLNAFGNANYTNLFIGGPSGGGSGAQTSRLYGTGSSGIVAGNNVDYVLVGGSVTFQTGGSVVGTWLSTGLTLVTPLILPGTSPATTGDIRAANNRTIIGTRNAANSGNISVALLDSGNNLFIGDANVAGARLAGGASSGIVISGNSDYVLVSAGSGAAVFTGGLNAMLVSSTACTLAVPFAPGYASLTPVNGAQTLSAANSRANNLRLIAGATGAFTITSATTAAAQQSVKVKNETSQVCTWQWASGTSVAIAAGASAVVTSDGTNAILMN